MAAAAVHDRSLAALIDVIMKFEILRTEILSLKIYINFAYYWHSKFSRNGTLCSQFQTSSLLVYLHLSLNASIICAARQYLLACGNYQGDW